MKMKCLLTLSILIASVQFTSIFAQNNVHSTDGVSELKERGPGGEEPPGEGSGGGNSLIGTPEQTNNMCLTDMITVKHMENDTMLRNSAIRDYNRMLELTESGLGRMDPLTDRIIPMVFHIIHQCGPEQVTDEQIINAVKNVNDDFNANNDELDRYRSELDALDIDRANAGLRFELATIDPDGYPTTGITRTQFYASYNGINMEMDLKNLIQWNPKKYLNVWVVISIGGNASAYAQFPETVNGASYLDGVVINHTYLGTTGTAEFQVYRRHILTHEIGHWAGLRHCWADEFSLTANNPGDVNNCNSDDGVCDTGNTVGDNEVIYPRDTIFENAQGTLINVPGVDNAFNGNTNGDGVLQESDIRIFCGMNTCPPFDEPNYAPIFNFMDYGAEFHFTLGQVNKMTWYLNNSIAYRDQIGLAADRDNYFIPETNNLATITADGVFFMENDLNDGSFLDTGIEIELSYGEFSANITNFVSAPNLPEGTNLRIERNNQEPSKATVYIDGNALNHDINDYYEIILTFEPSAFLNPNLPLYNNSIRFKTFFQDNQSLDYNVFDLTDNYNFFRNICTSDEGSNSTYAPFYIERVGYLSVEYFDGTIDYGNGDVVTIPGGFYLVNESDRQVQALCAQTNILPKEIEHLPEGYNLNKVTPSNLSFETLSRSPKYLTSNDETTGLLLFGDNQTLVENKIVYIGLKISSNCNELYNNELLGWIRVKIFADGKNIEILDGVIDYDPTKQFLPVENPPCIPSSNPDNRFIWIDKFELLDMNGEGLVNETGKNTDPAYTGYSDYSDSSDPALTITMNKDECYQVKITRQDTITSSAFYIWIDFDNDSFFEVDEKVLNVSFVNPLDNAKNLDEILCLPTNVTDGSYKMRVAVSTFAKSISNTGNYESSMNPCGHIYSGEFEDYTITISDGEEGEGDCVESKIFSNFIPSGETNTSDFIVIDGEITVANQEIILRAGDSICINTGFDANGDDNVDFDAEIQICEVLDTNCLTSDSLALVTLYNAANGPNWTNSWDLTQPVSTWFGIILDTGGCNVIEVNLYNNNLSGFLPPEIGDLNSLDRLQLFGNDLGGTLPPEIGDLQELSILYLSMNQFSGTIPDNFGNLDKLYFMALDGNQLSGIIPNDLGNIFTLAYLYLHNNNLSGCYPQSLCDLALYYSNFNNNPNLPDGGSDAGFADFCAGIYPCGSNKSDLNDVNSTIKYNDDLNVFAYPNPVHSSIIFDINLSKEVDEVQVQIVNIQGKQVESFTINNLSIGLNSFEHSLEKLSPGIYNYVILSNSDKVVGKFIKN